MIRNFEPADAAAVSAALHEEELPHPVTPAGVLHWRDAQPERAHAGMWVAEEGGRLVGWAEARIRWATTVPDVGDVWAFVLPSERRRGLGAALYAETEKHVLGHGARVLESWTYSEGGKRLLESRGFRATGTERVSLLTLDEADTTRLDSLAAEKEAEGFRLAPLRDVADRTAELHRVYAAASADVPEYFQEDDIRLEEWRRETLEHPQLTPDGSFIVLAGAQPVALALLEVDEPAGLAANEMTGTLPEFRRQGLARLAKLATIRWAAEQGLTSIVTGNADANAGMLRLNESLGYRPVQTETHFVRE